MGGTLRGRVAVVGVGETPYYKHGKSPDAEFKLALKAILAACEDAGISPKDVDGFASYADDRNDASRLAAALGVKELRSATMQWGGGGGGCCAAVANAAAAISAGMASCVVVFRALAQGEFGRFGQAPAAPAKGERAYLAPYGVLAPPQRFAMRVQRYMHDHHVGRGALRSIAMAANHHAQNNPRAIMFGKPLTEEMYDSSRWIAEPFRLFDCCMENDGAAAIVLVSAERARDLPRTPAYLLGCAAGSGYRFGAHPHNSPDYASANYKTVAAAMYRMAGISPGDVGSVQCYENFTGAVVMALQEHGFFEPEEANDFLRFDNLVAPAGKLPLNTSGGHLAECYMHGMGLVIEAVRQIRGESCNAANQRNIALVIGGAMISPVSNLALASESAL